MWSSILAWAQLSVAAPGDQGPPASSDGANPAPASSEVPAHDPARTDLIAARAAIVGARQWVSAREGEARRCAERAEADLVRLDALILTLSARNDPRVDARARAVVDAELRRIGDRYTHCVRTVGESLSTPGIGRRLRVTVHRAAAHRAGRPLRRAEQAVERGQWRRVQRQVPRLSEGEVRALLHAAVRQHDAAVVAVLFEAGVDPNRFPRAVCAPNRPEHVATAVAYGLDLHQPAARACAVWYGDATAVAAHAGERPLHHDEWRALAHRGDPVLIAAALSPPDAATRAALGVAWNTGSVRSALIGDLRLSCPEDAWYAVELAIAHREADVAAWIALAVARDRAPAPGCGADRVEVLRSAMAAAERRGPEWVPALLEAGAPPTWGMVERALHAGDRDAAHALLDGVWVPPKRTP